MRNQAKMMGVLLAAVVGGCASTRSTAVPMNPLAGGQAVDETAYDLTVDGTPGGRVAMLPAQASPRTDGEWITTNVRIENKTDRMFRVPTNQLFVTGVSMQPATLARVNGAAAP